MYTANLETAIVLSVPSETVLQPHGDSPQRGRHDLETMSVTVVWTVHRLLGNRRLLPRVPRYWHSMLFVLNFYLCQIVSFLPIAEITLRRITFTDPSEEGVQEGGSTGEGREYRREGVHEGGREYRRREST